MKKLHDVKLMFSVLTDTKENWLIIRDPFFFLIGRDLVSVALVSIWSRMVDA